MSSPNERGSTEPRRLSHDDYTVAIICPMGVELAPVIALLDEKHKNLETSRDQNAYELGNMGQHNIVVAVMWNIGNNAAASVITQLLNDFRHVRFGLLVGVGGGIPDEDYDEDDEDLNDIRLGDVVVSEPRGQFGGVVQFDRGNSSTGEIFVPKGHLSSPPNILAGNVEKLKAIHCLNGHRISKFLGEIFGNYAHMKETYSCPGLGADKLFDPNHLHQGKNTCKKCDATKTINRRQRISLEPRIHYGTIGSSNVVIEDSQKRNKLRDEFGLLCVEMEAAGLMEAFPSLVIRGISAYADSHKSKRWQPYAAATAAAYAKELLLQIPPADIKKTPTIIEAVGALSAKIQENAEVAQRVESKQLSK